METILAGLFIATVGGLTVYYTPIALMKFRQARSRMVRTRNGGFRQVRTTSGYHEIELTIYFDEHLVDLPLIPRVLIVREGADDRPLLNETQAFDMNGSVCSTKLTYPTKYGLQFKCFVDWAHNNEEPPSLLRARNLLEQNGWTDISEDGLHPGRFWFILPNFATKLTEDQSQYTNNWLPAGPPPLDS